MTVSPERIEEAQNTLRDFIAMNGYEVVQMADGERSALRHNHDLEQAQAENARLREEAERLRTATRLYAKGEDAHARGAVAAADRVAKR